jgi:hypothetical protein
VTRRLLLSCAVAPVACWGKVYSVCDIIQRRQRLVNKVVVVRGILNTWDLDSTLSSDHGRCRFASAPGHSGIELLAGPVVGGQFTNGDAKLFESLLRRTKRYERGFLIDLTVEGILRLSARAQPGGESSRGFGHSGLLLAAIEPLSIVRATVIRTLTSPGDVGVPEL